MNSYLKEIFTLRSGFSLVELSIVLVILGLLTGGILTGQNLIRAAEIKNGIRDLELYTSATVLFRDKYFHYPGDMANATDFWGEADADPATCKVTVSTDTSTCNGDGDGDTGGHSGSVENLRFWQHLANAGLIEGQYTGAVDARGDGNGQLIGINVPQTMNSATMMTNVSSNGGWTDSSQYFPDTFENISIGLSILAQTGWSLTPEEAYGIDRKLDDALPATGKMFTMKSTGTWAPNCSTTDSASTSKYNVSNNEKTCILYLRVR